MAQLTRHSIVVALCLLAVVGVAQVTSSGNATSGAKAYGKPASTKLVVLKCSGDSGSFTIKPKTDTVIFATPNSCQLQSFQFDGGTPAGFTFDGTDSDGNYFYSYTGAPPIPPSGYSFKYTTSGTKTAGNGTGVIK